jgi:hypothetical protein
MGLIYAEIEPVNPTSPNIPTTVVKSADLSGEPNT